MAKHILKSNNKLLKAGNFILTSSDDLPAPVIEVAPYKWAGQVDNSPVTSLWDTSGNNMNGIQTDPTKQAIFKANRINGMPTVHFNGVDTTGMFYDYPQITKAATVFFVVKADNTGRATEGLLGLIGSNGWASTSLWSGGGRWFGWNQTNSSHLGIGSNENGNPNRLWINASNVAVPPLDALKTSNFVCFSLDLRIYNSGFSFSRFAKDLDLHFGGELAYFAAYTNRMTEVQRRTKQLELVNLFNIIA